MIRRDRRLCPVHVKKDILATKAKKPFVPRSCSLVLGEEHRTPISGRSMKKGSGLNKCKNTPLFILTPFSYDPFFVPVQQL